MEVRLLGELEAVQDGMAVPVRGTKQRVLLALLQTGLVNCERLAPADSVRAVSHTEENDPGLRKLVGTAGFEPATPDPQARIRCLGRSDGVGRGAAPSRFAPRGRGESGGVGGRWLP